MEHVGRIRKLWYGIRPSQLIRDLQREAKEVQAGLPLILEPYTTGPPYLNDLKPEEYMTPDYLAKFQEKFGASFDLGPRGPEPSRLYSLVRPGAEIVITKMILSSSEMKDLPVVQKLRVPSLPWDVVDYTFEFTNFSPDPFPELPGFERNYWYRDVNPQEVEKRSLKGFWEYRLREQSKFVFRRPDLFSDFYNFPGICWNRFSVIHLFALTARLLALKVWDCTEVFSCVWCCDEWTCNGATEDYSIAHYTQARVLFEHLEKKVLYCTFYCSCYPYVAFSLGSEQIAWIKTQLVASKEFLQRFLDTFNHPKVGRQGKMGVYFLVINVPAFMDNLGSKIFSTLSFKCATATLLSTFSSIITSFLGNTSTSSAAAEARKISIAQLEVAFKFGDPVLKFSCRLYAGINLILRGRLIEAKRFTKREYGVASSLDYGMDRKHRWMCLGVWAKLQHAWNLKSGKITSSKLC